MAEPSYTVDGGSTDGSQTAHYIHTATTVSTGIDSSRSPSGMATMSLAHIGVTDARTSAQLVIGGRVGGCCAAGRLAGSYPLSSGGSSPSSWSGQISSLEKLAAIQAVAALAAISPSLHQRLGSVSPATGASPGRSVFKFSGQAHRRTVCLSMN
jgi:hypothetical protein